MAATVTLDAGLLVVPSTDVTAAGARAFVEGLLEWSRLLDERWIAVLTSKRAWEALGADDLLCCHQQLATLLRVRGVVEYSANDVTQVMDRLLYHPPWFEERLGVDDMQFSWDDITAEPDVLTRCAGPNLRREAARCLILMALLEGRCCDGAEHHIVALREAPAPIVQIRARIRREAETSLPSEKTEMLDGSVSVCEDVRGLISCIDECRLLRNATDDSAVDLACRVALYKARLARGGSADWEKLAGWKIGRRFLEAVQKCCRDSADSFAPKLLRAVSETIDDGNLAAVHSLRTKPGGNAPQRRRDRDRAAAWRRDVDNEYHLHYWRLECGLAEFSWVGPHNDFRIPE